MRSYYLPRFYQLSEDVQQRILEQSMKKDRDGKDRGPGYFINSVVKEHSKLSTNSPQPTSKSGYASPQNIRFTSQNTPPSSPKNSPIKVDSPAVPRRNLKQE
jgi:hypothetical protein